MHPIGILAALHDEIACLLNDMGPEVIIRRIGQRDYHVGTLLGRPCVVVLARIGKVAAAATTVTLIREFGVDAIVFTGLAGAVGKSVKVGDIVVAHSLLQHDLDARPLFPQYEVPLLGRSHFDADPGLTRLLTQSAHEYLAQDMPRDVSTTVRTILGMQQVTVHCGTIISGDCFVNNPQQVAALQQALPDALCVEMEGAAVAQICHEHDIPCAIIRTISDRADGSAGVDFNTFLTHVASVYSVGILRRFLSARHENAGASKHSAGRDG